MTDSSTVLKSMGEGMKHSLVNHKADEYVRYDEGMCVTTNTVEGYFATLKRGINGVYHHVGRKFTTGKQNARGIFKILGFPVPKESSIARVRVFLRPILSPTLWDEAASFPIVLEVPPFKEEEPSK